MTPEQLEQYIANLSPRDMMTNLDSVAMMARRIRLKQGVGSSEDELTLCRAMLDLKFLTELIDAVRASLKETYDLRDTYERMLSEKEKEIERLNDLLNGRDIQSSKVSS